jgi:hypothetical protein
MVFGCYSEPGPDADRRARSLIRLVQAGSRSDADSQSWRTLSNLREGAFRAASMLKLRETRSRALHFEATSASGSSWSAAAIGQTETINRVVGVLGYKAVGASVSS